MRLARGTVWVVCLVALGTMKDAAGATSSSTSSSSSSSSSVPESAAITSSSISRSSTASSRVLLQAPPRPAELCNCGQASGPVCGTNGKTYTNECQAACAGVQVDYEGGCYDYEESDNKASPSPSSALSPSSSPPPPPPAAAAPLIASRPQESSVGAPAAGCICTALYAPVCGANGKTYSNSCEARCAGVQVASKAACEEPQTTATNAQPTTAGTDAKGCACPTATKPICTTTGLTRSNECLAACKGEKIAYSGACRPGPVSSVPSPSVPMTPTLKPPRKPGCICAALPDPVCGVDGNTYSNKCEAGCYNVANTTPGECSKGSTASSGLSVPVSAVNPCVARCPTEGKQACGINGQTYINTCIAQCFGVQIAYPGACKPRCDACPTDLNPYCIATTGWGPRTFANCCFAKCNNIQILSQVLHPGPCQEQCVTKCDAKLEKPLCCGGKTYKNGCFAVCQGQDTQQCSAGRCSTVAGVENGTGCLLGPCGIKCNGYVYNEPVCGSDGKTYPDKCHLLCDQEVSIIAPGKCGVCAPNQPGGFPYCAADDAFGFAPVCGGDGKTYRNKGAAWAAGATVAAGGPCDKNCGEQGEACYPNSSTAGSTCCTGLSCREAAASTITREAGRQTATSGMCM